MKRTPGLLAVMALISQTVWSGPLLAAEFRPEKTARYGDWEASLYRNLGNNQLFCAAETRGGDTDFRVNSYKSSGETFIEVYNSNWTMMQGDVRFTFVLDVSGESYEAELRGRSWGDSYTHDFTDVKSYNALLGLLARSGSIQLRNSNSAVIATFSGHGAMEALDTYRKCVED
jgi:hypothetical protein